MKNSPWLRQASERLLGRMVSTRQHIVLAIATNQDAQPAELTQQRERLARNLAQALGRTKTGVLYQLEGVFRWKDGDPLLKDLSSYLVQKQPGLREGVAGDAAHYAIHYPSRGDSMEARDVQAALTYLAPTGTPVLLTRPGYLEYWMQTARWPLVDQHILLQKPERLSGAVLSFTLLYSDLLGPRLRLRHVFLNSK